MIVPKSEQKYTLQQIHSGHFRFLEMFFTGLAWRLIFPISSTNAPSVKVISVHQQKSQLSWSRYRNFRGKSSEQICLNSAQMNTSLFVTAILDFTTLKYWKANNRKQQFNNWRNGSLYMAYRRYLNPTTGHNTIQANFVSLQQFGASLIRRPVQDIPSRTDFLNVMFKQLRIC